MSSTWTEPKPEPKELGRHDSYVTGLALAGSTLVSGGYDGRLIWWNVESHSRVRDVLAHSKWIRRVAVDTRWQSFSPAWPTTWCAGCGIVRAAA